MNNSAKIISLSQLSMLDVEDVLHFALISAMDLSAVFANILLIVAILSRTPKTFAVYAVILLNITLVDLTTSLTSWLCTVSIQNIKLAMVMIYVGPCTLLGARWCQAFISLHVAAVDQSIVVLVISFAYRLWILKRAKTILAEQESIKLKLRLICFFSAVPTVSNAMSMAFSGTYPDLPNFESRMISVINLSDSNFPSVENIQAKSAILPHFIFFPTAFTALYFMRRKLLAGIGSLKSSDRVSHHTILHTLTIQLMLPIVYILAMCVWLLDAVGIVESTIVRRMVVVMSSVNALATPLVNLYYLPPYRRFLMETLNSLGIYRPSATHLIILSHNQSTAAAGSSNTIAPQM